MSKGYNAFVRKIANKIVSIQSQNEDANTFFESTVPEWKSYTTGALSEVNTIENTPLGSDPRKKEINDDDDIDYFFKIKNF
jgi:hypothetical protein